MKFEVKNEIGRGGFGIVERGRGDDGKDYALKTLNLAAFSADETADLTKRFEREVRYQSQVNHPNVVEIVEFNLDDDPPWFVMPLAIGSLADDIDVDRTLGGNPRKPLFDILAGLEAIHNAGFYHRDLKPANVLKFKSGKKEISYRVSDFGLTTPGAGLTSTLTGSNMGGGTVLYRAPECANNFRRATAQADIYSFGAILHDVFHGGPRIPHTKLSISGELKQIIEKCTESNARRRYRSVARLREDLFNVLQSEEFEFDTQEERELIELISNEDQLDDDQWDRVFNVIDENEDRGQSNDNIMRAISGDQIEALYELAPDMFHGLGELYAKFAMSRGFQFDYCDIISDKAQIFYDDGDLQLKAKIALAMLELGTSHNRWRVENQFIQMAGAHIDDALADRIKIEIQVEGVSFLRHVEHLEGSIDASREDLHPKLRKYLKKLAK